MFTLIDYSDKERWDEIVKSFPNYEVYYLHGYVGGFKLNGDGDPLLILFTSNDSKAINVVMKRDISDIKSLTVAKGKFFDITTPYGYGGFLVQGVLPGTFVDEYQNFCLSNHFICEFTRLCPFTQVSHPYGSVHRIGSTISVDTTSLNLIEKNLTSQNRNKIRKAIKNDVVVDYGLSSELINQFIPLYFETMDNNAASQYYYFREEFFFDILRNLKENALIFYAQKDNHIIAMAIVLYANNHAHYHLSCLNRKYQNFAPVNLIIYKIALWCLENQISQLHLGGGVGSSNSDSLFEFKKSFNRYFENKYYIGKFVIDTDEYAKLTKNHMGTTFFPQYRMNEN